MTTISFSLCSKLLLGLVDGDQQAFACFWLTDAEEFSFSFLQQAFACKLLLGFVDGGQQAFACFWLTDAEEFSFSFLQQAFAWFGRSETGAFFLLFLCRKFTCLNVFLVMLRKNEDRGQKHYTLILAKRPRSDALTAKRSIQMHPKPNKNVWGAFYRTKIGRLSAEKSLK
ncbi:hypothetical protein GPALN_007732 [Globodera pallida]|nr:hypothetical protein GPALN_007732 [Globodera pallida]